MKRFLLLLLGIILVSAVVLGSCGTTAETSAPPAATTAAATTAATTTAAAATTPAKTTAAATTTPAVQPKYGGVLINMLSTAPSGNFGWLPSQTSTRYSSVFYETLLDAYRDGHYEGCLAESWKLSPDLLSVTLTLRKGVTFHDGSPFNAQACKWNLEYSMKKPACASWRSVEIIDEYTVKLSLSSYRVDLLGNLGNIYGMMMSPTAFNTKGQSYLEQHPVGTGPFMFDNYKTGVS